MSTELATKQATQTALTQYQGSASVLQGEDADDSILPRLHIFQGLPKEREMYGKFDEGDLVNTLTKDRVATKDAMPKFVPLFGWVEYIRFGDNGTQILYRERDKARVPAADLEWTGEGDQRQSPAATKYLNWVVLMEGQDTPLVMSFKSTSLAAGRQINSFEKLRGKKGPGLYAIELKAKSNAKGSWLSPSIRPAGNPTPELLEQRNAMLSAINPESVTTNLDADTETAAAGGDDMPPI